MTVTVKLKSDKDNTAAVTRSNFLSLIQVQQARGSSGPVWRGNEYALDVLEFPLIATLASPIGFASLHIRMLTKVTRKKALFDQ